MSGIWKKLALALGLVAGGALLASGAVITGIPSGFSFQAGVGLQDGTALNAMMNAEKTLIDQAAGTTAGTYKGVFNGTLGVTTPAVATWTVGTANTSVMPDADDGAVLGSATVSWSDLFLASGGVINWANGNCLITHSSALLTHLCAETFTGAVTPTGGVAAAGGFTVSCRLFATGNEGAIATTSGSNLDIVTTETYRAEVWVPANCSSTGVAVFNGTAVAGNLTAYLISSTGAQVTGVLTASTAASGTTAYQLIPWTGGPFVIKGPATYWIAIQGNNSGGDLRTHTVGAYGADKQTGTTYGTLTVATSPTTFTTAVGPIANLY